MNDHEDDDARPNSGLVGTIEEIWRYPVSSLGGERINSVEVNANGVPGDRIWCVVDAETGLPAAPEKEHRWRAALFLQSRLTEELPEIGFPDGQWFSVEDDRLKQELAHHFSFAVEVRPYAVDGAKRSISRAVASNRYQPSPVHVLTTGSLDHLSSLTAGDGVCSRRFRPTVVVRTATQTEFAERSWIGRALSLGSTVLCATEEAKRCGMTLIPQPGLKEDADILRTIVRRNSRNFGIYCSVLAPGAMAVGDAVSLDNV